MISYIDSSLFTSPAQTLVNTVNTFGVMGKGIAKDFKQKFPAMFNEYKSLCNNRDLSVGKLHLWQGDGRWVLNFPTKTTWRKPSRVEYIEAGLRKFVETYEDLEITSISFPPLGCGNGGLEWAKVQPLMEKYLSRVHIPVFIHGIHVPKNYTPEHKECTPPDNFDSFLQDILEVIRENNGRFSTSRSEFDIYPVGSGDLVTRFKSGKTDRIDREMIAEAWLQLRSHILSSNSFSTDRERALKSYLFPLIEHLPYVVAADYSTSPSFAPKSQAYFLNKPSKDTAREADVGDEAQGCLFH